MEFKAYPFLNADLLTLNSDEDLSKFVIHRPVKLMEYQGELLIVQGDIQAVANCSVIETAKIIPLIRRDQVRWLLSMIRGNNLMLQYCMPVEITEMPIEIGIDSLIADDLFSKQEIGAKDIALACKWMAETFLVSDMPEGNWLTVARFSNRQQDIINGFQMLGLGWRADIEQSRTGGFLVKRLTRSVGRDVSFSLLTGGIVFKDVSVATLLNSPAAQAALKAALRDNASYLELWQLYNNKEWQRAQKEASALGSLHFVSSESFEDGRDNAWRLIPKSVEDFEEFQKLWKSLDLTKSTEVDVNCEPPNWAEELNDTEQPDSIKRSRGTIRFENDCLVFKTSGRSQRAGINFQNGWIYLSLAGYKTAGKRRLAAKQAIDSGKRLPQLKWLLDGVPIPAERRRKLIGLTTYAKESFKGGKPTEKQCLALETALNTPDIAVIIGPPGTGKTQVIAALQRRLAEEAKDQNLTGKLLISSFQHDAVDNALERSDVFKLPATRVGGKHREEADERLLEPWLARQSAHLQSNIAKEYQKYPELELINTLSQKITVVRISNQSTSDLITDFVDMLSLARKLEAFGLSLPYQLEQQWEDYVASLKQKQHVRKSNKYISEGVRVARALRTDEVSFNDDGPDRCWDALRWLERSPEKQTSELIDFLNRAANSQTLNQQELDDLFVWQSKLLNSYLPDYRPGLSTQQLDTGALSLLDGLEKHLEQKIQQRKLGIAWALQQLQNSIESDRAAALAVIEEYSMVIGATCQQAASEKMANLKAVTELNSDGIEFDTVIVDEAARANPLDLFIPMSMAKRRIILVGDDRQLPHMLEPDIEGDLLEEHQLTELHLAAFRSSLFERLRLQLIELERQDNLRRVVMLDTQFRMHPKLGEFVSQQFYEGVGLGKIHSGRPAEDFGFSAKFLAALAQDQLMFNQKICQWIDIPAALGKAKKSGTSQIREVEAERITEEVVRLLEAGGEELSIGVITFYAAQRDLILQKLTEVKVNGITPMVRKNGEIEPHEDFKWVRKMNSDGSANMEERLRVGSVDAFQGKEFDVVLLSSVRTYKPFNVKSGLQHNLSKEELREDQFNRQFGFLRLPNRMNVAMSRQRKMLICVGDAKLASCKEAEDAVPALHAFYKMCGGQYGVVR